LSRAVVEGDTLCEAEVRVIEDLEIEVSRNGERDEEREEEEKEKKEERGKKKVEFAHLFFLKALDETAKEEGAECIQQIPVDESAEAARSEEVGQIGNTCTYVWCKCLTYNALDPFLAK
jgi:hypothetical protein